MKCVDKVIKEMVYIMRRIEDGDGILREYCYLEKRF